jgi:hypothetical protein
LDILGGAPDSVFSTVLSGPGLPLSSNEANISPTPLPGVFPTMLHSSCSMVSYRINDKLKNIRTDIRIPSYFDPYYGLNSM